MDWAALKMEAPFLIYDFISGRVSGLTDVGPYYGRSIDGLGPRRELVGLSALRIAWLSDTLYTLAEAPDAISGGSSRRKTE